MLTTFLLLVIWVLASAVYMMLDALNGTSRKILPKPLHLFMLAPVSLLSLIFNRRRR